MMNRKLQKFFRQRNHSDTQGSQKGNGHRQTKAVSEQSYAHGLIVILYSYKYSAKENFHLGIFSNLPSQELATNDQTLGNTTATL